MRIPTPAKHASAKRRLKGISAVSLLTVCLLAWTGAALAQSNPSIVGLWHFELLKQDGSLYYQSLQQYHADGLEMEDAATPPTHPAHICMGVWKQDGNTVSIYHIIWVYDGDGPAVGYVVLKETNTLSPNGNTLSGTYDMKQYDLKSGSLLGHMTGTTAGRRIDFDHPFNLFGEGANGAAGSRSTAFGLGGPALPPC